MLVSAPIEAASLPKTPYYVTNGLGIFRLFPALPEVIPANLDLDLLLDLE
jgi:hypothetical protein